MSIELNERHCQRDGCKDKASKHWTRAGVGNVVEVSDIETDILIPIDHSDLCERHVSELQEGFGGHVRELTDPCSPGCPINS